MLKSKNIKRGMRVRVLGRKGGIIRRVTTDYDETTVKEVVVESFDGEILYATPSELGREEFDDPTRFNWGFHDGAATIREGRQVRDVRGHYDPAFALGYVRGLAFARANLPTDSSIAAWLQVANALKGLPPFRRREYFAVLLERAGDTRALPAVPPPASISA